MKYKVPQLEPYVNEDELNNLKKVIDTGWLTEGPFAKEFLEKIQNFTEAKYAVLANNGTLALFLSLLSIGIKTGDEVIVPDFTFNASGASVVFTGAKPVFVDINESDLQIDVTKVEIIRSLSNPTSNAISLIFCLWSVEIFSTSINISRSEYSDDLPGSRDTSSSWLPKVSV